MANFIERTLEPGEKVIFRGRLHWSFNFRYTVFGVIVMLLSIVGMVMVSACCDGDVDDNKSTYLMLLGACILFGALLIGYGYFIRSKTEFAITNTRFIQKDGIFDIKMTEIPLFKVETVNFYQSFFERMIDTGAIELVGSGGTNHKVCYVEHPYKVRNIITTYMKESKQQESN